MKRSAIALLFVAMLGFPCVVWATPPNVILIVADDLGYGDISPYGGWIETPHLDALAREGVRFTDFHSSGNVCSPTRAGLLTGRYQHRAGLDGVVYADPAREEHYHGIRDIEWTLAEALSELGYATTIYGKWHLGYLPEFNPTAHGFDEFRGFLAGNVDYVSHVDQAGNHDWWIDQERRDEPGYVTNLIHEHALAFIEANRDRPFFLYLPHAAPHYPYQGPADPPERTVEGDFENAGSVSDKKRAYREMVQALDDGIGRIVAALDASGLRDNTLIWFFSDNGAARQGSNAPLRGQKGSDWEGGHRVPSIANWPGKIPPATRSDLVSTIDIMPTVLALAGYTDTPQRAFDGVDVSELLLHGREIGPREMYWKRGASSAMRDGEWKLLIGRYEGNSGVPMLFNLNRDIGETQNLASQYPERVERMNERLEAWVSEVERDATPQRQPG